MHVIASQGSTYVLSFLRGEEVFAAILTWAQKNHIQGGIFTGLGAADQMQLAYYHLPSKTYEKHEINEEVEILSLTGNLGMLNEKKVLHVHGVFGRRDLSTIGGHLFLLKVSGACEIHFTAVETPLNRAYDEETGLNLLCPLTSA